MKGKNPHIHAHIYEFTPAGQEEAYGQTTHTTIHILIISVSIPSLFGTSFLSALVNPLDVC